MATSLRTKRRIFDLNRMILSMLNKASNFDHKYDISFSPTLYIAEFYIHWPVNQLVAGSHQLHEHQRSALTLEINLKQKLHVQSRRVFQTLKFTSWENVLYRWSFKKGGVPANQISYLAVEETKSLAYGNTIVVFRDLKVSAEVYQTYDLQWCYCCFFQKGRIVEFRELVEQWERSSRRLLRILPFLELSKCPKFDVWNTSWKLRCILSSPNQKPRWEEFP